MCLSLYYLNINIDYLNSVSFLLLNNDRRMLIIGVWNITNHMDYFITQLLHKPSELSSHFQTLPLKTQTDILKEENNSLKKIID